MKRIFSICLISLPVVLSAQTGLIAHKSHSGNALSYRMDPTTNFGQIEVIPLHIERLPEESFIPINDSTFVRTLTNQTGVIILQDTLINKEKTSSILFQYNNSVLRNPTLADSLFNDSIKTNQSIQQETVPTKSENKKPQSSKKSSLLIYVLLTGGVFLFTKKFLDSPVIHTPLS